MIHSWPITSREEWLARRKQNVNASEAAALFGPEIHPHLTPFKLWALKCERVPDPEDNPLMERGRLFEPVVIEWVRRDHPDWRLNKTQVYFWDDATRLGCTPDVDGTRPDVFGDGIIQIKTVGQSAWKRRWHDENGEIAIPTWVAVQASVEAYLTGSSWAGVAAMKLGDGGTEVLYFDVPLKHHLIHAIEDLTAEFWRRVAENDPYDPDYGRDRKLIFDLFVDGTGPILDLSDDIEFGEILQERDQLKEVEKAGESAAAQRKALDARLITKLGNSPAARGSGRLVTIKMVKKKAYTVKAQHYPLVKVRGVEDA